MKTLFRLIVLVLLVAGWGLAALSLHVVRAQGDRIVIIPKQRLGIEDTYVDARGWTISNVADHRALVERIVQSDKADSFKYVVDDPNGDVERQLRDAVNAAPPATKPDELHRAKTALHNAKTKTTKAASQAWWDLGH